MTTQPNQTYQETQILTAPPQKLRLMLIERALRLARQAVEHWRDSRDADAWEAIIRCRAIVAELLASVRLDGTRLTRNVSGIYLFLFRTLTEASRDRDAGKIQQILDVLEVEQETWQQVCGRLTESPGTGALEDSANATRARVSSDTDAAAYRHSSSTSEQLSWEA